MKSYYNANYFKWQKYIGEFGGKANLFKFEKLISKKDKVVDFGSGGGYLLKNLMCAEKIGIEINKEARKISSNLGLKTVTSAKFIPKNWADVVISNHALEHCERPLDELKNLRRILRPGGKIIFVLPHERNTTYKPKNVSQHLYTWSEVSAGNLFSVAGFSNVFVDTIYHTWPPFFMKISDLFGMSVFHLVCRLYALLNQDIRQVRVIASK